MSPKNWSPGATPGQSRQSAMSKRLFALLADGEWHDRDPIVRELMKMAPPGEAWRRAEDIRVRQRIQRMRKQLTPAAFEAWMEAGGATASVYRPKSMEEQVRIGARAMANATIGIRSTSRIEQRVVDGRKQIRLVPLHPKYSQSRARQLREEWVRVNGEVKTEEQAVLLRRFVHREMGREAKKRRRDRENQTTD